MELSGKLAGGTANAMFVLRAMAVAGFASTYLYRPLQTGNPFPAQLVISGVDVPLHFFFIAALALVLGPVRLSDKFIKAIL